MDLKIEMRKALAAGPACIVKNDAFALRSNLSKLALHTRNNCTTYALHARCERAISSLSENLAPSDRVASRKICATVATHRGTNDAAKRGRICEVLAPAQPVLSLRSSSFAPAVLNGDPALRGQAAAAAEATP